MKFNLYNLSIYRTELMGFAALMILICHAVSFGVIFPSYIRTFLSFGNIGVDIFLFVSGFGCGFSLSSNPKIFRWYSKRLVRIFIPYFLIQIPFLIVYILIGKIDFLNWIYEFSTFSFWTQHTGAWYVALLFPLYFVTPLLYLTLTKINKKIACLLISLFIIIMCYINWDFMFPDSIIDIWHNVQWAFGRTVSFVIGLSIFKLIKQGVRVNLLYVSILSISVYLILHILFPHKYFSWLLEFPIMGVFVMLIDKKGNYKKIFVFWGVLSLESYLANIYLMHLFETFQSDNSYICSTNLNVVYIIILVLGTIIAYLTNKIVKKILSLW